MHPRKVIVSEFADDPGLASSFRDFVASLDQKAAEFHALLARR